MSDPFYGEIRMFGGNFAPRNWAFCSGGLLAVADHNAVFSLLGTTYGGDGRTTFGLPDMRGRLPINQGTGPGLSPYPMGATPGVERVTLSINELPSHTHSLQASTDNSTSSNPGNDVLASHTDGDSPYTAVPTDPSRYQTMNSQTVASTGGNQSHTNMMPYQCVSFIICLVGLYPSRN
ncbi:MAG: microcystin-dependent protein [Lentisphaeria bacterium]|jgi:microcystin-dependent protein